MTDSRPPRPPTIDTLTSSEGSDAPRHDPLELFLTWYAEAEKAGAPFVDAFALATSGEGGRPSVRYVLFKGLAGGTLRFVTNFESRKAHELENNAHAAIAFFWPATNRQVRMEGTVARAPESDSDGYFAKRDRVTQLGAWASQQSRPLANRGELEAALAREDERFRDTSVPRPPHWGMLAFTPNVVELWASGANRLHDRFRFERTGDGWRVQRLAP